MAAESCRCAGSGLHHGVCAVMYGRQLRLCAAINCANSLVFSRRSRGTPGDRLAERFSPETARGCVKRPGNGSGLEIDGITKGNKADKHRGRGGREEMEMAMKSPLLSKGRQSECACTCTYNGGLMVTSLHSNFGLPLL